MSEAGWNVDLLRAVGKAWKDKRYREKLLADPVGTLRERGFDISDDVEVEFVQNSANKLYIPLPAPRPGEKLSSAEIEQAKQARPVFDPLKPVERSFEQEPIVGIKDQLNASRN